MRSARKNRSAILPVILLAALLTAILPVGGCGWRQAVPTPGASSEAAASVQPEASSSGRHDETTAAQSGDKATTGSATASAEPVTLRLWHIWGIDSDSNKKPFEKALSDWKTLHPDTRIEVEATENETYKVKLRTAIAVNEAPDIFYSWGAGFAKPFIESGKVLALDPLLSEETRSRMMPGSLDNFTYGGSVYGLPTFRIAGIFYCNTDLFDKYKLQIPETFAELLDTVAAFRANGITPMALGAKDGWPAIFYQNVLAIRTAGIAKCQAALRREASFDDPDFVASADMLRQLVDAGAFDEACIQTTQYEADQQFISGRIPMYFSGSWFAGTLEQQPSPVTGKVRVRNFPSVDGAHGDQTGFVGGTIDAFMFSAATQHPREAVDAMIDISQRFCAEGYLSGSCIPAWQVDVDASRVSPLSRDIVTLLGSHDGYVLAWDTMLTGLSARTHINLVTDVIAGRRTPEAFAVEMQKLE